MPRAVITALLANGHSACL